MRLASLITLSLALASAPALAAPKRPLQSSPKSSEIVDVAEPSDAEPARVGQLAELTFRDGSSQLALGSPKVKRQLDEVAAWAEANPDGLIVLDGHADARGSSSRNVRLSLARAQVVRTELLELGVDPHQIVIAPYGEAGAGRRGNRRVIVWGTSAEPGDVVARTRPRRLL